MQNHRWIKRTDVEALVMILWELWMESIESINIVSLVSLNSNTKREHQLTSLLRMKDHNREEREAKIKILKTSWIKSKSYRWHRTKALSATAPKNLPTVEHTLEDLSNLYKCKAHINLRISQTNNLNHLMNWLCMIILRTLENKEDPEVRQRTEEDMPKSKKEER